MRGIFWTALTHYTSQVKLLGDQVEKYYAYAYWYGGPKVYFYAVNHQLREKRFAVTFSEIALIYY